VSAAAASAGASAGAPSGIQRGQPSTAGRGVSAEAFAGGAGRGFLASAAAAVEAFFLEDAGTALAPASDSVEPLHRRPVIAVFGLARGCGATVIARALAAELAARDLGGAAALCCDGVPAAIPGWTADRVPFATHAASRLATHAASRLARVLEDVPGVVPAPVGRLCLVRAGGSAGAVDAGRLVDTARHHAPVVIDAGSEAVGGAPVSLADRTVIVSTRDVEPALARVASDCVARVGAAPVVVLNRAPHEQPGLFAVPNSALGARLALGGREARGELGRAIGELVDLIEEGP
jgi:hypothetical protein